MPWYANRMVCELPIASPVRYAAIAGQSGPESPRKEAAPRPVHCSSRGAESGEGGCRAARVCVAVSASSLAQRQQPAASLLDTLCGVHTQEPEARPPSEGGRTSTPHRRLRRGRSRVSHTLTKSNTLGRGSPDTRAQSVSTPLSFVAACRAAGSAGGLKWHRCRGVCSRAGLHGGALRPGLGARKGKGTSLSVRVAWCSCGGRGLGSLRRRAWAG